MGPSVTSGANRKHPYMTDLIFLSTLILFYQLRMSVLVSKEIQLLLYVLFALKFPKKKSSNNNHKWMWNSF